MNYIDIVLLILLAWGLIQGLRNGLVHEVASLAALILGIWGAIKFSDLTAGWLIEQFNFTGKYLHLVAFAITFIGIVIAVHFVAKVVDKLVKAVALGWINRLSGAAFGILKTALIVSVLLVILNTLDRKTHFLPKEKTEGSFLYTPLSGLAPMVFDYLKFQNIEIPLPKKNPEVKTGKPPVKI